MMKRWQTLIVFGAVALISHGDPLPASAAHDEADILPMAEEIHHLHMALEKLAEVSHRQERSKAQDASLRKLEIAINYLNFRSRRIERLENDVQKAQTTRGHLEDSISQLEERRKLLEEQAAETPLVASEDVEFAKADLDLRIKSLQERLARLDGEIIILGNKIQELQDEIESVESFVQKNLEL